MGIDPKAKTVRVKTKDREYEESYDKLLLSPGGFAPVPDFDGVSLGNIHTFRGPEDTQAVYDMMKDAKKAIVIGAGFIGMEVAEAYQEKGLDVTVIDMADRILNTYLDREFTDVLEDHARSKGMNFALGEGVKAFEGKDGKVEKVITDKGEYPADAVVVAVGVKPDTSWLEGILEIDDKGFLVTNEYLETSEKDIYAGGDSTLVPFAPTGEKVNIGLATLARRQGIVAALNAMGGRVKMPEVTGTGALSLFDYKFVSTGIKDLNVDSYKGEVASKFVKEKIYPDFMRKDEEVLMKIHYDKESHRILGAQLMSTVDVTDAIAALSMAITAKWTLEDLALLDIHFQPRFDRPWHFINVLAMAALDYKLGGADKLLF